MTECQSAENAKPTPQGITKDLARKPAVSLMFSGGLDSTVTALTLADDFEKVHLLTYNRGYGHWLVGRSKVRVPELEKHLEREAFTQFGASVKDLFRKVVLDSFVADFKRYKALFIVCVGCKMAMHARSVIYNLEHGIPYVSDGASEATAWMPDQMPVTLAEYRRLHEDYGLTYTNPVYHFGTREKARETLREAGLSMGRRIADRDFGTQPICLFGDVITIFREFMKVGLPLKEESIVEFMRAKRPILDDYIKQYFTRKGVDIDALKERVAL
ncbi:MAG: hypothetical protein JW941_01675 [Candidatus Coatesbacteria bacterium]|nr:hypothetical protein [Candidatus Coatesbacteria bacterium]